MNQAEPSRLESILRLCADAAPQPWYPSAFAQTTGVPREHLDPFLDQLRLGGLIQLTDWVQGLGQGYALTDLGREVLQHPRALGRLQSGQLPPRPSQDASEEPDVRSPEAARSNAAIDGLGGIGPVRVTWLLIFLNVAWFVVGMGVAYSETKDVSGFLNGSAFGALHKIGALRGIDIVDSGEYWRLLSCCFVHFGLIHLLVNMYSLYAVGPLLERIWGSWRFAVLYLLAGFGGSCAMVWETAVYRNSPGTPGAGASGALWGILGSMAAWLILNRRVLHPRLVSAWKSQLISIFLLNVFITFYLASISKGAHFGGGVIGFLAAFPMDWLRFGKGGKRLLGLLGLIAIPIACDIGLKISLEDLTIQVRVQTQVEKTLVDALNSLQASQKIFRLPPNGRDANDRANIAKYINEDRESLSAAQSFLRAQGPFFSTKAKTRLELCERAVAEVSALADRMFACLEKQEEWTDKDRDQSIRVFQEIVREFNFQPK